ncbi:MAG: peptidylprolyl isomerase [Chlamydiales bacterium]|jgi:peptidylprolyl isomerase
MNKKYMLLALTVMSYITCFAVFADEEQEKSLAFDEPEVKRISEAFGHLLGSQLDNPGFKYDLDSFIKGIQDAAAGKESPMTEEEYERAAVLIQENIVSEVSSANLRKADQFMSENSNDRSVFEIEKGRLQYAVIETGEGPVVGEHGVPLIHYTAKYLDGTVFGSSVESGSPISLPLDQTLPGLKKGLIGTKEGEKRRLFIHPTLANGANGLNALLIFDVEVIKADTLSESKEEVVDDIQEEIGTAFEVDVSAAVEEGIDGEVFAEEESIEIAQKIQEGENLNEISVEDAEEPEEAQAAQ